MVTGLMASWLGGPTTCILNAVRSYTTRSSVECVVAYVSFGDEDAEAVESAIRAAGGRPRPFLVSRRPRDAMRLWAISGKAALWMFGNVSRFDVVELNSVWNCPVFCAAFSARLRGVPAVVSPHESLTRFDIATSRTPVMGAAKNLIASVYRRLVDRTVFSSSLERSSSLVVAPGVVVPHAVTAAAVAAPPAEDAAPTRFGYLGRFHPKKRAAAVIEAFAALGDPAAELVMAGDGQERARLEGLAAELGVDGQVRWTGFLEGAALEDFFAAIDVLVMPSEFECFGMSAAEAMAHGRPVIVTDSVGLSELVRQERCGWVIGSQIAELAEAMEEATRPGVADAAGRSALRAVADHLTFAAYAEAMHHVHLDVMAEAR